MNSFTRLALSSIALAGISSAALAQSDEKKGAFWIFGPLGIEYKLDEEGKASGAVMMTGVLKKENGSTELKLAPGVEYMIYPQGGARGLGYGARAVFSGGVGVGPSVAYVSRPKSGLAFRTSFSFPFGKDYVPFMWEIGLGFQF